MKLATTTPTDFAAFGQLDFIHTTDYQLIDLEAKKRAYARHYERYKLLMEMEAAGITVTVTLRSEVGTITIENDVNFEPMDYLESISKQMRDLAAEILDLTARQQQGLFNGDTEQERKENDLRREAHALCLPASLAPTEQSLTPAASRAA